MKVDLCALRNQFGKTVRRSDLLAYCAQHSLAVPKLRCVSRGRNPVYAFDSAPDSSDSPPEPVKTKSVEVLRQEIAERFDALEDMAYGVLRGHYRALIVAGNPGIGKTYTIERALLAATAWGNFKTRVVHGYARASGLYGLLYDSREASSILMLDDCDSIFGDETSLNMLKTALDTTKSRHISWLSEYRFKDENGNILPNSFTFDGAVIFVTNMDFERSLKSRLAPHIEALLSRSYYLDLHLRSAQELFLRLEQVVQKTDMVEHLGITPEQGASVLEYIRAHQAQLREVSLRTVVKLANVLKASQDQETFERIARLVCWKQGA